MWHEIVEGQMEQNREERAASHRGVQVYQCGVFVMKRSITMSSLKVVFMSIYLVQMLTPNRRGMQTKAHSQVELYLLQPCYYVD